MQTCTDQCSYSRSRLVRERPWRASLMAGLAVLAAMSVALATCGPVQAAVFECHAGDVECLIASINTANGNGEDDTITLAAGTYTVTTVDHEADGPNGLPAVTSPLTIRGSGADSTILERAPDAPSFRLLHVSAEGVLRLEGLTVRGGWTDSAGGGLVNRGGTVTVTQTTFAGNQAEGGAGLWTVGGTVDITAARFLENGAGHPGGGLLNCGGTVTIAAATFARNTADAGTIINGNHPDFCAGTLESTLTIVHTTIADNEVNDIGGLLNMGAMLVLNSAIVRNRADSFDVGGIANSGTLTLLNTTVAGNIAPKIGGIANGGTLTLINTTVADNQANDPGVVGGLENGPGGSAVLINTLLVRNTGGEGVPDCLGAVTSQGHNLIGDPTGCTVTLQPSDLTGDPGLGSLVEANPPGHAHIPLLAGSPAINAGNNEVCVEDSELATDQLGQPRVGVCDIGAIEFQALVEDTTPLAITIAATPTTLWPPNGKLVPVRVSGVITDAPGGSGVDASSAAFRVLDEYGRLQPHGRLTLGTDGRYAFTVALEASRRGNDRDGRHYTVEVSATDQAGNLGGASTVVTVPHDQGKPRQH
jgi:hypothetical protein